jgi:hypothetical protein
MPVYVQNVRARDQHNKAPRIMHHLRTGVSHLLTFHSLRVEQGTTRMTQEKEVMGRRYCALVNRIVHRQETTGKLNIPNGYEDVSVLIVRWDPKIDEYRMGHDKEVSDLLTT